MISINGMSPKARVWSVVITLAVIWTFGCWYIVKDIECKFEHGPKLEELEKRVKALELWRTERK